MSVSISRPEEKRCSLIAEYTDDHYCLELLQFFARYPHTRFSRLAIIHALNDGKLCIEKALKRLADRGILRTAAANNIVFYSLTEDEPLCRSVRELARFDWHQRQQILRGAYPPIHGGG